MALEQWDPETTTVDQLSIFYNMLFDMLLSEEETQIYGIKLFVDLGGVSRKLIEAWSDPKLVKNYGRILQVTLIMKHLLSRFLIETCINRIVCQCDLKV